MCLARKKETLLINEAVVIAQSAVMMSKLFDVLSFLLGHRTCEKSVQFHSIDESDEKRVYLSRALCASSSLMHTAFPLFN